MTIGKMEYDGLITDLAPAVEVRGRVIAHFSSSINYPRGTIFARSALNNKLYPLGSVAGTDDTLTPDCVLCDDTFVDTVNDVTVAVYTAGCFNPDKCTTKDSYQMTEADKDALRTRNIVFKAAQQN
ncbi:MAG: head decoration protein [Oscillospiraceae bacterium]|nr:head decoration protein [Oscillospiraceae bacterium]